MFVVKETLIVGFSVLCVFLCEICVARDFRVVLPKISESYKPSDSNIVYKGYVVRQLHQSTFRFDKRGVSSNILERWSAHRKYTQFNLCLDRGIRFSNGKVLTVAVFKQNLERFSSEGVLTSKIKSIFVKGDCLKVNLISSNPDFPKELAYGETSIVDPATSKDKIPIGISPYSVALHEPNKKLVLQVKPEAKLAVPFERIIFTQINGTTDFSKFDEINLIQRESVPKKALSRFSKYTSFSPNGHYLLLNHENHQVRARLTSCFSKNKLVEIISTNSGERRRRLDGIFPMSLISGVGSKPKYRDCKTFKPFANKVSLKMITFMVNSETVKAMQTYMNAALNSQNIFVHVDRLQSEAFLNTMLSKEKKYDISHIGISSFEASHYFQAFVENSHSKRILSYKNDDFLGIKAKLARAGSSSERKQILSMISDHFVKQNRVLPLFERAKVYYYPKWLDLSNTESLFTIYEYRIKNIKSKN